MIVFLYFHFHGRSESWDLRKKQKFVKYLFQEKMIFRLRRHFRPKLFHWNKGVNCTPIDRALKMRFNKGLGSFLGPAIPEAWKFFYNQLCCFFDKITTQIQEDFEQFFVTQQGFLASKKVQKIQFSVQWLYNIYLTKAKSWHFHCLLKTLKYKCCPKFRTCPK